MKLGGSHSTIVTVVPIGAIDCELRGGSTREGVTDYLSRVLAGSDPFRVAPSTKNVLHRVTVGDRDSARIRGFYLYTPDHYATTQILAAADGSPVTDWMTEFAHLSERLPVLALHELQGALQAPDWQSVAPWWNPNDLAATEQWLRRCGTPRELSPSGIWAISNLLARVLFDQGKNEEALAALNPIIEMGVPWWLLQARDLAGGRLALTIGATDIAFEAFWGSVCMIPGNGVWDCGYLLESLYELAFLDNPDGPPRSDWAQLALQVAQSLTGRGSQYTALAAHYLFEIQHGADLDRVPGMSIIAVETSPAAASRGSLLPGHGQGGTA